MITIVTTTNDRPLPFMLLEKWMKQQTVKPHQWLIVNDGKPYNYHCAQQVIERTPLQKEGPSVCENWLEALSYIKGDKIIVCEDDDYYGSDYIKVMSNLLDEAEVVGVCGSVYYFPSEKRFTRLHNISHCALACTAFRSSVLPFFKTLLARYTPFVDGLLWREWKGTRKIIPNSPCIQMGIKGLPGKANYSIVQSGTDDWQGKQLIDWIGKDGYSYLYPPWLTLSPEWQQKRPA